MSVSTMQHETGLGVGAVAPPLRDDAGPGSADALIVECDECHGHGRVMVRRTGRIDWYCEHPEDLYADVDCEACGELGYLEV